MLQINHSMTEEKRGSTVETPDPQVKPKAIRRAFTTAFKLSILEQADQCQGHGAVARLVSTAGSLFQHVDITLQIPAT